MRIPLLRSSVAVASLAAAAPWSQVWTGLLLVDTSPLKATLCARADTMIGALLQQLLDKSIQVGVRVQPIRASKPVPRWGGG